MGKTGMPFFTPTVHHPFTIPHSSFIHRSHFTTISPIFRHHITTISPPYHQFTSYFPPISILFIFYISKMTNVTRNEEYTIAELEMVVK